LFFTVVPGTALILGSIDGVVISGDAVVDDETPSEEGLDRDALETVNATTIQTENVAMTTNRDEIGNVRWAGLL
jgi:hypothetical protein